MSSETARKFRRQAGRNDRRRNVATPFPAGVTCVEDLRYGSHGKWNKLNVYFPEGTEGALPVIVSIHGGGYVYGTKEVYHFYCGDLARRGFTVVNFNYRLAPEARFPAQLTDINHVFLWLLENAAAYHADMDRLFIVGDSAGAQLASHYAAILTNPAFAALYPFSPAPVRVRALGLNCGMYDLPRKMAGPGLGADYLGEDFDLADPRLDVLGAIGPGYPPAHITTAFYDFLRDNARPMAEFLQSKGIPAEWTCYGAEADRYMGHVFHVDIRLEEAGRCNDEQCAFFRRFCP